VLAVVVLAAGCGSGKPTQAETSSPYLLPTYLPVGFKIYSGSITHPGPAAAAFAAAVGRPSAAAAFDGVVLALVSAAKADRNVPPGEHDTRVDVNGTAARLRDDPTNGAVVDLFANGFAVVVTGPAGAGQVAIDVARRVHLPADGRSTDVSLDGPPDGYRVIASAKFMAHAPEAGYEFTLHGPPPAVITGRVYATMAPLELAVGGGDRVESASVRGHDAVISTRRRTLETGFVQAESAMAWYERSGVLVTLQTNSSSDVLRPVAEGLSRVTQPQWLSKVPVPPS
jgi:hypothetical protein